MKHSQFPHVCTQIAGHSVADFYAAFPRDAAENSAPTVVARWHKTRWHFITRIDGFLFARMHADENGCLWVCTGKDVTCFAPDGRQKLALQLGEPVQVDGLAPGTNGEWGVLYNPSKLLTISGNSRTTTTLATKGDLTSLCSDRAGRYWAGGDTLSLLSRIRGGEAKPLLVCHAGKSKKTIPVPAKSGSINFLLLNSCGALVVSLYKGPLFQADADLLWAGKVPLKPLPATEIVTHLADDLAGGLFGVNANSIYHLLAGQKSWEKVTVKTGGKKQKFRCLSAMPEGLVLGTYQGVATGPQWERLPLIDEAWYD